MFILFLNLHICKYSDSTVIGRISRRIIAGKRGLNNPSQWLYCAFIEMTSHKPVHTGYTLLRPQDNLFSKIKQVRFVQECPQQNVAIVLSTAAVT